MDFFQAQDSARGRTRTLVVLFVLAVLAIIAALYVVVHFALGPGPSGGVDPGLLLLVTFGTTALVAIGSTVRTMQLRQGGPKVAELLGGRRVRPDSSDEGERRLINVVEEMAIASGTPVPAIYVLDHEAGINAFAAGYTLDDAAVAVTRGTLDALNRDELQGVIAHEFSHILNGDMRLNIRLMGLLFGILLLAIVGRGLLHTGGRGRGRRDSGSQIAVVGLALIVIGYIGVFFGKLIQAAVSRQREYLADAAAVQFTRSPDGIAGALKKIGGASDGSRIANHHAQEAGHLFFANGLSRSFTSLMATHPPLADRIRRVDPAFAGDYPELPRQAGRTVPGVAGAAAMDSASPASVAAPAHERVSLPSHTAAAATGASLLRSVGAPQPEHVAYAGRMLASLPDHVRAAAHDPDGAVPLLMALLLHDGETHQPAQHEIVTGLGGADLLARAELLADAVRDLGPTFRLPLLDLLTPALRQLSPEQQHRVRDAAARLAAADGRTDIFEFALLHILGRQLASDQRSAAPAHATARLDALGSDLEFVLSAIAWSGADRSDIAGQAFGAAAATLAPQLPRLTLQPRKAISLPRLEAALERVRGGVPGARRRALEACITAVAHDGAVQTTEAELLRAVAEAIDCPMPPVLPQPSLEREQVR